MFFISHRGNVYGPNPKMENHPSSIDSVLNLEYNVEVDIWMENKTLWLGHDKPQYKVGEDWIYRRYYALWFHCKDLDSLKYFVDTENKFIYFWHQNDDFTLTSFNHIWTYPKKTLTKYSICVLPEKCSYSEKELKSCAGICSDKIEYYRNFLKL